MTALRKLIRAMARAGQGPNDTWPVVLLLAAVLLPVACLLWFMSAAMQNERLAARQKLADVYRGQLAAAQTQLEEFWRITGEELESIAQRQPGPEAFAECIRAGAVDSVLVLDDEGRIVYPNAPARLDGPHRELDRKWTEASEIEYARNDPPAAARAYEALARSTTNVHLAARAFQATARCLVRAGARDSAIGLISETLMGGHFEKAADPQGRLIALNAQLLVLELMTNRVSPAFLAGAQELRRRVVDYGNPILAAPQRRFLMNELQKLDPHLELPTLAAEQLAAQFCERTPDFIAPGALSRTYLPDLWQFMGPRQRVLALFRSESLFARMKASTGLENLPVGAEVAFLPPGVDQAASFVTLPAGPRLPGWRLALSLRDEKGFDARMEHRTAIYLWAGVLVLVAMGILGWLAVRLVRRQTALSRLKNDLVATVSHELKTPLAAMRVLVDTLLEARTLNEQTTREYLQLVSQENERLSRLIQNFLAFSRMERHKHTFQFGPLATGQLIDAALAAVRDRLTAPGCQWEVQKEEPLPEIIGDMDALVTALVNLLDNACKYTEEIKHIRVRAGTDHGWVYVSVQDNGIGIAARDVKKIFRPFHQTDARLSRRGSGCGLGLSIVQFIVAAHRGRVSVCSQPGRGSTFTLSFPAVLATSRKEAIA